jgi:hypothetical protein
VGLSHCVRVVIQPSAPLISGSPFGYFAPAEKRLYLTPVLIFKTRRYVNVCPKPVLANSQPFLNLEIAQTKRAFRTDLARPIEAQPEELP